MNDDRRYHIELTFKTIGAVGVLCGIVVGIYSVWPPNHEPKPVPPYAQAVLQDKAVAVTVDDDLRLAQFEIYAIESGYTKTRQSFAAAEPPLYTTYALDAHYTEQRTRGKLSSNPIFSVVIQNHTSREVLLTRALYRVHKVGQVKGGAFGPLWPNAKYKHGILWKVGDQVAPFAPPYRIGQQTSGNFLLEIRSLTAGHGLAWLVEVIFLTSENRAVRTERFQLVMSKAK